MLVVLDKNRTRFKHARKTNKSLLGQSVLVLLGLQILFFTAFVGLSLPTATERNLKNYWLRTEKQLVQSLPESVFDRVITQYPQLTEPDQPVRFSLYTPEAPAAIFVGYILGFPMATIAAVLYVLLGLFGPLGGVHALAAGGGLEYYSQPGFGYLLGIVVSTLVVGQITDNKRSSWRQLGAAIMGILAIHLIGLVYMLGACVVEALLSSSHSLPVWQPWISQEIRNLTWYQLPYDFVFALILVAFGFPFKWLVKILTVSDKPERAAR